MKSNTPPSKVNRLILEEASEWFVDFRVGDVDSTARERFDRWLRQSPEHIRAYMEIANTYVGLPALNPTCKMDVQYLIAHARSEGNVVPLDYEARSKQPVSRAAEFGESRLETGAPNAHPSARRRGPRVLALAASIAIACVIGGCLAWLGVQWHFTYATDIGERRSITLEDGSTIDLNARSKVRVRFSDGERDVELLEGQALFSVAHDVSRPFIVSAGNTAVRAVGTQFDVYRKSSGTTVTVVEGRVAVFGPLNPGGTTGGDGSVVPSFLALNSSFAGGQGSAARERAGRVSASQPSRLLPSPPYGEGARSAGAVLVSAGEQVTVTERPIPAPTQANVAAATAWTQHQLVFDGSPLSDVVDGFNRYNTRQIVIEDHALDEFHVSGVYSSTDPASLIGFLRQQPGIDVIETGESVRITRK
jgi:transmembrane sensor